MREQLPSSPIRHRRGWRQRVAGTTWRHRLAATRRCASAWQRATDHAAVRSAAVRRWLTALAEQVGGWDPLDRLAASRAGAPLARLTAGTRRTLLSGRRASVAVVLLLLLGAAPALAATSGPARPDSVPGAAPESPPSDPDALAERADAADAGSRSLLREWVDPHEPHRPRGTQPDHRPPPPPEPEPDNRDGDDPGGDDPRDDGSSDGGSSDGEDSDGHDSDGGEDSGGDGPPAPIGGLSERQMSHAATIVQVGQDMDLPEQAYVVAIATALQESNLRVLANPTYPESYDVPNDGEGVDHDSVGLFQQRPASGWGTVTECMDPERSSRAFYEALRQVPGWEGMPITVAAQTVQVSAFPGHYAKHEPLARDLVAALT